MFTNLFLLLKLKLLKQQLKIIIMLDLIYFLKPKLMIVTIIIVIILYFIQTN